ncbi:hypothetical protein BWK59_05975 [Flavobacterium davisii]|nr:hypothetical protein BWK59_05975 [Flavobacterium davisii]
MLALSTGMQAKFLKAKVYYTNGTQTEGFAKLVECPDRKVSFRKELDGDTEKIKSDELDKIEYTTEDGDKYVAERMKHWSFDLLSFGFDYSKSKKWFYFIYEKANIKVYTIETMTRSTFINSGYVTSFGDVTFFFKKKGDEVIYWGLKESKAAATVHIGRGGMIKKMLAEMFKGKCKSADEDVDKIEYNYRSHKDYLKIVDIIIKYKCK